MMIGRRLESSFLPAVSILFPHALASEVSIDPWYEPGGLMASTLDAVENFSLDVLKQQQNAKSVKLGSY